MTARALLVPDCGPGVGLGHLERMLALADALSPDPIATVVVPAGDSRAAASRRRRAATTRWTQHGDAVARALSTAAAVSADVIVLDGYGFDVATQQRLRELAPLVVVDDLGHTDRVRHRGQPRAGRASPGRRTARARSSAAPPTRCCPPR